jgi:signal peptidase I
VTFGFQVARVDGESMTPTLEDHDRLIVNKLVYQWTEPKVGDVVMHYWPEDPNKTFVKRIVAAEGDTIRSDAGKVYRNEVLMGRQLHPRRNTGCRTRGDRWWSGAAITSCWVTTGTTVWTAAPGAKYRRNTSSERFSCDGGR